MKQKTSTITIIRTVIQIACFLLIPGLFIDSFNGIKAVVTAIAQGTPNILQLLPQLFSTVLLLLATLVFGRFFCGFMCAFGTLGDAFHFIGSKLFKIKVKMPEKADRILKWAKYVLLAVLFVTWIFGIKAFAGMSPWDAFGMLDAIPPDFGYAFTSLTIGTILLFAMMIGSMFIERFFCRYFCPMGAVFSITSKLKTTRIKKQKSACGKCRVCTNSCAMGIPMYKDVVINSGECIECMKCTTSCPRKNVRLTVAAKDAAPLVTAVAAASVMGLYFLGNVGVTSLESQLNQKVSAAEMASNTDEAANTDAVDNSSDAAATDTGTQETAQPSASSQAATTQETAKATDSAKASASQSSAKATIKKASGYTDGTYEGSGVGFHHRTTTVSVTIKNGKITDINTVSTGDDHQFYNAAFSSVADEIISKQKASVNAVSGATFSSNGIMDAVADALSQAKA